jgi:hypothetical protein
MAQAPATILQEINGLYVALYDRAADNAGINFWSAQLGVTAAQAATTAITPAQATLLGQEFVTTQSTYFTATYAALNDIQFVEALYGNIGGNAGDPAGIQYWYGLLQAAEGGSTSPAVIQAARAGIVGAFVDQLLSIDLTVGAAVLGLSPTDYAAAVARQMELLNKISVSQFYANESALPGGAVLATPSTTSPAFQASIDVIGGVTNNPQTVTAAENAIVAAVAAGNLAPILALVTAPTQPNATFTLTTSQDTFVGTGFNVFNAPLVGNAFGAGVPTLSSFDSLVSLPNPIPIGSTPVPQNNFSVLNASFSGTPSPQQPGSLNIQGIPIWNISQDLGSTSGTALQLVNGVIVPVTTTTPSNIILTGDATGGPSIISGLMTLNFSDDETNGSLYIGDNSSPVYEPIINGVQQTANGFAINVFSAVGTGHNGVDVDIAAAAFTGKETINVTADVVGGFSQTNGSYNVPPEILVAGNDGDDYNPNWLGYLANEFSIGAGASAGPNGPIGFQTWNVNSIGAKAVGTLNIIGLGGEGSTTATTINLTDDGSNTMLFANAISDGLSTDWKNVTTVNLAKTTGFVTITGLETNVQEVGISPGFTSRLTATNFATAFNSFGGGGLLASDTTALVSIVGGAGNSFYDLSSLTPAAATKAVIDGGHGTAGNSEVAFNNAVMTSGLPVTITNIQVLDDVSSIGAITVPINNIGGTAVLENDGEAQGGIINMVNFAGLTGLNTPYALLAENLTANGGLGVTVPYGLPYTLAQFSFTPPASQAALLPAGLADATLNLTAVAHAADLQNGVVAAGFSLLQLLNADGSTQTVLGAPLTIFDDTVFSAINMQDTADGWFTPIINGGQRVGDGVGGAGVTGWAGFNITIWDFATAPNVNTLDTLDLFVSDDGVPLSQAGTLNGVPVFQTALFVPQFTVDNYTTVDIVMPFESTIETLAGAIRVPQPQLVQDYVILGASLLTSGIGQASFVDQPVVTVTNATLNFFDNHADNGGSPPGGPSDLVLGDTNFTDTLVTIPTALLPAGIGVTSVAIDATTSSNPAVASTTINDFGLGSFEIGATNATNLNAQSTSHLVMDLPGTLAYVATAPFGGPATGITVNGSLIGQNLLQGTSGTVVLDFNGHNPTLIYNAAGAAIAFDVATVYEDANQALGQGWGNDTLTGGDGFGTLVSGTLGGAPGLVQTFTAGVSNAFFAHGFDTLNGPFPGGTFTGTFVGPDFGPGNTGDNFFTLGGNDVVNIAAGEIGTLNAYTDIVDSSGTVLFAANSPYAFFSTVWVGAYDVCNSAGANSGVNNLAGAISGVGTVYDQAITDIVGGVEKFVDGYGNSANGISALLNAAAPAVQPADVVTINGFHFGGPLGGGNQGDTIVFAVASWATGAATSPAGITSIDGLVMDDGATTMVFSVTTPTVYDTVGSAFPPSGQLTLANVVLDAIGPVYANAAALQQALGTHAVGNLDLAGTGVAAHTEVDILVAYNTGTSVNIADVTLANTSAAALTDTAAIAALGTAAGTVTLAVHDLVHITSTLGLANFSAHNIYFIV